MCTPWLDSVYAATPLTFVNLHTYHFLVIAEIQKELYIRIAVGDPSIQRGGMGSNNRFDPATDMYLSQARTRISNVICRGSLFVHTNYMFLCWRVYNPSERSGPLSNTPFSIMTGRTHVYVFLGFGECYIAGSLEIFSSSSCLITSFTGGCVVKTSVVNLLFFNRYLYI